MKRIYLYFLFVLISFVMLYSAPHTYSRYFCQEELLLFLVMSFLYLRNKIRKCGIVNFDFFFLLSYLLVNYIHPSFVYPNDKIISAFNLPYNENIIPYALAVAQLGISIYMLGNVCSESKRLHVNKVYLRENYVKSTELIGAVIAFGVFAYVFLVLKSVSGIVHLYPRLMILLLSVVCIAFYNRAQVYRYPLGNLKTSLRLNILNIISFSLFTIPILSLGSRDLVIFLGLFCLGILNMYYLKIKVKWILPLLLLGGGLMIILVVTRQTNTNLMSSSFIDVVLNGLNIISESKDSLSLIFIDFIINARNLYDGIDIADKGGFLYGATYIQYLFVFIPFAGGLSTEFFTGKTLEQVHTGKIITDSNGAGFGLGTNVISDIYMNFSIYGVILLMFLFGIFVAKCEKCNGKYKSFAYLCLLSNSLYIPRASIFCWLDLFAFIVIVDFVFNLMGRNYGKKKILIQKKRIE